MDLAHLAEFAAVVRCGSMKGAAAQFGLSPATLSARIAAFEKSLGVSLFRRGRRELTLTPEGERLLPNALDILNRYQLLTRDLRSTGQHPYQALRIGVTGSNLPLYLGPFLDRLNATHPNIQLILLDDTRYALTSGLKSGAVDLYFAYVMEGFEAPGLACLPTGNPSQYVLLPRTHPLCDRTSVSLQDLEGECFLLYPETKEGGIRNFQLRNLRASGIDYTVYDSETSPTFYKLLVPIGKGLILSPSPIMDLPPNTMLISVRDVPHPAALCLFHDAERTNPEVEAFLQDFAAFIKEANTL